MAGSNNITKWLKVNNREDEITLKYRKPVFLQITQTTLLTNTFTPAQLFSGSLVFTSGTPNALTAPTMAQLLDELGQGYLTTVGSTFQVVLNNTDAVSKTITFPGIGAVVVPANTQYILGLTVTAPGVLSFYQPITNVSAISGDPFPALGTGYIVKTGPGTYIAESITGTSPIVITNGNGVAGQTNIALDTALTNLDTLLTGGGLGYVVQTGPNTVVNRTITGTAPVIVTNGNGVAGNTNIAVSAALTALSTQLSGGTTGYMVQTGPNTIVDRTFQAGLNIALTNPDGVAGNTTISFQPTGGALIPNLNNGVIAYSVSNTSLVWSGTGTWLSSDVWAAANPTRTVYFPALYVPQYANFGSLASWDTNGDTVEVNAGSWGTATPATVTTKKVVRIATQETNTNAVAAPPNNYQGLRDPKSILVQYVQGFDSTTGAPALALSLQRWKAFSLFSATTGGTYTGDYTGEVAYLRGDGTYAGVAFNITSSELYKKEIEPLTNALELISLLQPVTYLYNDEAPGTQKHFGLIVEHIDKASETRQELKSLVTYGEDDKPTQLRVDHLLALSLQALKELSEKFDNYVKSHP